MEFRLNKLISDAGICSRREADKLIESGRVTVNGKQPHVGEKITVDDLVEVDGEKLTISKRLIQEAEQAAQLSAERRKTTQVAHKAGQPREHYGKFNKYAAARKAAKEGNSNTSKKETDWDKLRQEASSPKFGRSLKRSAVAQRMAASPKSAALRKTSRNNPLNKMKRNNRDK
ncbi:MAG: S4 domain-containing protein [Parabacteroides sp.]